MPFGVKPVCSMCKITHSSIWRKGPSGEVLCNSCGLKQASGTLLPNVTNSKSDTGLTAFSNAAALKNGSQSATFTASSGGAGVPVLRKSTRIKPTKKQPQVYTKSLSTKGKGRRIIFKKTPPTKAPAAVATFVTGESVFHKDQYYQTGDIVSLMDHGGGVFYAQLRGFLSDQYNEKSAVLTWLLPTARSPPHKFDPHTYILGPEEDLPRRMEFMEFVCHAPSDYFRARDAPYRTEPTKPDLCYIWTSVGPSIRVTPSVDEIFGVVPPSVDVEEDDQSSAAEQKSATKLKMEKEKAGGDLARLREKSRVDRRARAEAALE